MSIGALLLLALGVSMDNFAVSLGVGTAQSAHTYKPMLKMALAFGILQFFMPLLGWLGGSQVAVFLRGYQSWILCASLVIVGWRMLRSTEKADIAQRCQLLSASTVLSLGFATSLDSLAVGFGLAMIDVDIFRAAGIIGIVTVCVSFAATLFGVQLGQALGRHGKFSGGLLLVIIGLRALVAH
jgi:manganese efflux pump family protein